MSRSERSLIGKGTASTPVEEEVLCRVQTGRADIVRNSDKPIAEVVRELGIHDSTLVAWVKQDEVNRGERERLSTDEPVWSSELEC